MIYKNWISCVAIWLLSITAMQAAELSVSIVVMNPDTTATAIVSGVVTGEDALGNTILLQIVSRSGNTGTVTFTPAPPIDILQLDDPWPGVGTFTKLDTDLSFFLERNGAIGDNGTFTPEPLLFSGPLASFPVVANIDANGIWDIVMTTSLGDSNWEGLTTTLMNGTITVLSAACFKNLDCNENGIIDTCDIDCGESGGVCDVAGCGESLDLNTNCIPDDCESVIPTLSEWGLVIITLLLLSAGTIILQQRRILSCNDLHT